VRGRFIAYYRVSTDKQGKSGLGLEAQRKAVLDHLDGGKLELIAEFTEIESGRRNSRPELEKALAACKKYKAKLVIAKLDRLSRDVAFIATLMSRKVDFVCCDNPTATKFTIHILAAVAEHERDMIADRTRKALAAAKAKGKQIGNPDLGRKNKQEAIERAEAVRPAITSTLHLSTQAAADELNSQGIQTASGGQWHAMQVHRVRRRLGL
jgi:DNA invertase Pin-like site-specific DNA recombinase